MKKSRELDAFGAMRKMFWFSLSHMNKDLGYVVCFETKSDVQVRNTHERENYYLLTSLQQSL